MYKALNKMRKSLDTASTKAFDKAFEHFDAAFEQVDKALKVTPLTGTPTVIRVSLTPAQLMTLLTEPSTPITFRVGEEMTIKVEVKG